MQPFVGTILLDGLYIDIRLDLDGDFTALVSDLVSCS